MAASQGYLTALQIIEIARLASAVVCTKDPKVQHMENAKWWIQIDILAVENLALRDQMTRGLQS